MVIILMGVSGCGKSTVGRLLAERLNLSFFDADDFHPDSNVEKMKSGVPLNDEDRRPWLLNLRHKIEKWKQTDGAILACSALKKSYRDILRKESDGREVKFIFLKGTKSLISVRLETRDDHYMPVELLNSQFDALEEPENAITVSIEPGPEEIVNQIVMKMKGLS